MKKKKLLPVYPGKVDRGMLLIATMLYLRDCSYVSSMYGYASAADSFMLNATDGGLWKVTIKRVK